MADALEPSGRLHLASESDKPAVSAAPTGRRLARLVHGRFWLLLGAGGALALLAAPVLMWLMAGPRAPVARRPVRVEDALAALDAGDLDKAQAIAQRAINDKALERAARTIPRFVLGMVKSRSADASWLRQPKRTRAMAVAHLRIAHRLGFPEGREAEGLHALGHNLLLTGHATEAREPLQRAIERAPDRRAELLLLLAQAHALGDPADLAAAEQCVDRLLEMPQLDRAMRDEALVEKAGLALLGGRLAECQSLADQIADDSPLAAERQLLRGRMLLAEARATRDPSRAARPAEAAKLQAAIDVLRTAQSGDTPRRVTSAKAMYLIGTALAELGQPRAALKQFDRTRLLHFDAPEGLAAELATAELLSRGDDAQGALEAWRRTAAMADPPDALANPWVTREELSLKLLEAHRRWLDARQYGTAVEIARLAHPILPRARAVELEAETLRRWGQESLDAAESAPHEDREALARAARETLRRAGRVFEQLAELDFEQRQYPLHVWHAAECAFQGRNYSRTVALLERYRKHEARRAQAAALSRLGQAHLALGKPEAAVQAFEQCIANYPKDNEVYTARLWEAQARQELQQPAEAEQLLRANLTSDTLTPASREWRETLLALARLLHDQGRDPEAIEALEEWTERYPQAAEIHEANYRLALVQRRQASALLAESTAHVAASVRAARRREARQRLEQALARYSAVIKGLRDTSPRERSPAADRLLRNALFARGATLSDLGRFAESIEAYSLAGQCSGRRPEVLEAYTRIAAGHRRIGQTLEARSALEQARVALARLPADTALTHVTNYDRVGWTAWIDWLKSL